jgi:hypothetical protein
MLTAFAELETVASGAVVSWELEHPTISTARAKSHAIGNEVFIIVHAV